MQTCMSRHWQLLGQRTDAEPFGTLKTESLHHYRFASCEQARQVVFEYIEVFYNRIRACKDRQSDTRRICKTVFASHSLAASFDDLCAH